MTCDQSVTRSADPQLLVPPCTHCLTAALTVHRETAALLYSPGWRLFLTQNIKTDTTNINQTHRALPASPPALTLPRWSPVVAGGTSWDHHRSHSEELLITCL